YIKNIAENPDKYPKEAKGRPKYYAGYDIKVALNMHFTSSRTHELWDKVIARGVFTKEKD
ncbi:MAG: hypothetical protein L6408_09525, partial [Nanoarchaeota archaeon]|nr:hypothetical protein [Nanoarchaeota archaeon]